MGRGRHITAEALVQIASCRGRDGLAHLLGSGSMLSLAPRCQFWPVSTLTCRRFVHDLREDNRANMFEAWKASSRNDAILCRGMAYSAFRCEHARTMAAQAPKRASFMTGAFRSPAADAVARGSDPTCPSCWLTAGTTEHVLWHCARLGWPTGRQDDEDILNWACHVRSVVLQHRYADNP